MIKYYIIIAVAFSIIGIATVSADEFRLAYDGDNLVSNWVDVEYKVSEDGGWDGYFLLLGSFFWLGKFL